MKIAVPLSPSVLAPPVPPFALDLKQTGEASAPGETYGKTDEEEEEDDAGIDWEYLSSKTEGCQARDLAKLVKRCGAIKSNRRIVSRGCTPQCVAMLNSVPFWKKVSSVLEKSQFRFEKRQFRVGKKSVSFWKNSVSIWENSVTL